MKCKFSGHLSVAIVIVIMFVILQTATLAAHSSTEDWTQAYRIILSNATLYGDLPVVFKNVCGDDVPEMIIWCRGENPSIGETDLQIWGYKNGAVQKLLSLKWLLVSGASHQLYLMNDGRLAWQYNDLAYGEYYISILAVRYYSFNDSGACEQTGEYSYDVGYLDDGQEHFEGGTVNGKSVGEEDAKAADIEMKSNIVEQIYPAQIGGMSRAEAQSYLYSIGESQPAPTLNLDKYVGKWYTYNDWMDEVGDLSISKRGDTYILNCSFYRLGGIDDAIITSRVDGTATFAEQAGSSISGTLKFDERQITMTLDEIPNFYFDCSLTQFFNGATHIYQTRDGGETNPTFQHTIKSDPKENRDFAFNKNEEVEQLVLSTSASQYNPRLANFLAVMARSAYNEELIKSNYEELGISVSFNNSFGFENAEAAYVVGKKQLVNDAYLVFVTIRGSYGLSWVTDFAPGTALSFGGWHDGFELCVNILHKNIKDSFGGEIPTNARYVITGHSLGAAVGNLLATKLNEDGVPMNFVYAYNFACPDVANDWDWAWNHNGEHNNIFNIGCCQDPVTFVPGALADYFSWPWLFWGKYGQNVWFSENWNNLDKLMLDPSSHDMETYVDYMAQERPFSEFRSYSEVFTSIIGNQLRTILGILCPVDVTVKNSNGDKLLSIIGDKVEYFGIDPEEVIVCFNGDEKCIVLPNTDDVTIEFLATGDGAMTYTAAKVNLATREEIDSTRFSDVPLIAGKTFSSSVSGGDDSSNTTLFETDADGRIVGRIEPDEVSAVSNNTEPPVKPSDEHEIKTTAPDIQESNETVSNRTGVNVLLIAAIAVALSIITIVIVLSLKAKSIKNSKNER